MYPHRFHFATLAACLAAALLLAGCQGSRTPGAAGAPGPAPGADVAARPAAPMATAGAVVLRVNCGADNPVVDAKGQTWAADVGYADGNTVDRGAIAIAGTDIPEVYRTERYKVTGYRLPLANGRYLVRLHFAETFDRVTAAGQRVFSFAVEGQEVQGFDIFAAAGAGTTAVVKTCEVTVADGKLDIAFTAKEGANVPCINGIEVFSAP